MLWFRALFTGLPLVIAIFAGLVFHSVRTPSEKIRNEITIAHIGDAKLLNPILLTTSTDNDIARLVFNGLVKLDENLEIAPDLAKSWEQRQTSTAYFLNPVDAKSALETLHAAKEEWKSWNLVAAEITGPKATILRLHLSVPGVTERSDLLRKLDPAKLLPITTIRVDLETAVRESAAHFLETTVHGAAIIRSWAGGTRGYELVVVGDALPVLQELTAYYEANASLKATITPIDKRHLLDEPELHFLLNSNVRWHDGEPFTAVDVEFTYRMIMNDAIASPRKADYSMIRSVEVRGPDRLKITYRRPYSPALLSWTIGILPEHTLEGRAPEWWSENFNRKPIGTGPFQFDEWQANEFLRLRKNPGYFEGEPHLDAVIFRTIPDPVAIRLAFETRQVDFWNVPPHAIEAVKNDARFLTFTEPVIGFSFIGWNLRNPLFQNARVRRALAHGVDVKSLIKFVLYGHGEQSDGTFPPQLWFHSDSVEVFEFDREKARALLADAGWAPGPDGILVKDGRRFTFHLITNQGNEVRKDIATLVQADLRELGIDAKIEIYESAVFFSKFILPHDFDACVLGWNDILSYDLFQIWHSSQSKPGGLNFVSYSNHTLDEILDSIRATYQRDAIKSLAADIQSITYRDQPYLYLYVPTITTAMRRDAIRIQRPVEDGWHEEPITVTAGGWDQFLPWFYRPEFSPTQETFPATPAPLSSEN